MVDQDDPERHDETQHDETERHELLDRNNEPEHDPRVWSRLISGTAPNEPDSVYQRNEPEHDPRVWSRLISGTTHDEHGSVDRHDGCEHETVKQVDGQCNDKEQETEEHNMGLEHEVEQEEDDGLVLQENHDKDDGPVLQENINYDEGVESKGSGQKKSTRVGTAVELCGGCGGLALAAKDLGYHHEAIVESEIKCIDTLKANGFENVIHSELKDMDYTDLHGVELLTAGLPCQPWSTGGRMLGDSDARSLWHEAVRAVREIRPACVLFEMVRGFLAPLFESTREKLVNDLNTLGYTVDIRLCDAADYLVPQHRRRCIILARLGSTPISTPAISPPITVRQALSTLGEPNNVNRHEVLGQAKTYPDHPPSHLDKPARTIRAGTNGPGGGSNTLLLDDGSTRYFTIRELARIQGFPDTYKFDPVWSRAMKEIGNACPPPLARAWLQALIASTSKDEGVDSLSSSDEGVATQHPDEGVPSKDTSEASPQNDVKSLESEFKALHSEAHRSLNLVNVMAAQTSVIAEQLSQSVQATPNSRRLLRSLTRTLNDWARIPRTDSKSTTQLASRVARVYEISAQLVASQPHSGNSHSLENDSRAEISRLRDASSWRTRPSSTISRQLPTDEDRAIVDEAPTAKLVLRYTKTLGGMLQDLHSTRDSHHRLMNQYHVMRQEAYFQSVEAKIPTPNDAAQSLPQDRTIFIKVPASMIDDDSEGSDLENEPSSPDSPPGGTLVDFYSTEAVGGDSSDDEDDPANYQSLKATLTLKDDEGNSAGIDSVVDSGAAWCGIRFSTLKANFPQLVGKLQKSNIRFRDASGQIMRLVGKVRMTVRIGSRDLHTTVHVFRHLSAEFLLGMNALRKHKCVIDCNTKTLYVAHDTHGTPVRPTMCEDCEELSMQPIKASRSARDIFNSTCCPQHFIPESSGYHLTCDKLKKQLILTCGDGSVSRVPCSDGPSLCEPGRARLVLDRDVTIEPGQELILDPLLVGLPTLEQLVSDPCAPELHKGLHMSPTKFVTSKGLQVTPCIQNPLTERGVYIVSSPATNSSVVLQKGLTVAYEDRQAQRELHEDRLVTIALVLPEDDGVNSSEDPPGVDEGGIEFLKERGFSLDRSIDPELRNKDGTYEPLSEAKRRSLYKRALRHYQVWSVNPKVPKLSLIQVLRVPTGDAPPQAQSAYPIPVKLRRAAMKEIESLLGAGLIEPSMSDWCSPAIIIEKKDSELDEDGYPTRVKFAIDYRRTNSYTQADQGGLGNQADILYGIGGRYKFIGLCDAAGGFYQYLLDPKDRHKTAFILPASMGGTLFQWRVAPYGLTRNPAGYSRGMQWTLKGMSDLHDLDWSRGKGGASSWLDDICLRATSFDAFVDLFDRMLERLATSQITLKGSKCELLLPAMDLLGFVATPHGLMMQEPKLKKLMVNGIPSTPSEAKEFLGAVAFLRRMVPRISLLTAPMTAAVKDCTLRHSPQTTKGAKGTPLIAKVKRQVKNARFNDTEQTAVDQSWHAVMDHLDSSAVVCSPDFEDPLAHFVLCTDASDFAVGGVLMQWQRDNFDVPTSSLESYSPVKGEDPLDSRWRSQNGYHLVIIGYYSKTLDPAQKNYPIFDKEAGAILLCVRHWSDLISYHPTTVYTDSSVAASMLTKHAAPPRLQRWGLELGSYLPHLRIAFRRGTDNGLADLLSRYPIFSRYVKQDPHDVPVTLPDDLFNKIGDAPLFNPSVLKHSTRDCGYLASSTYELYEPKKPQSIVSPLWSSTDAPAIPGRGKADRLPSGPTEDDETLLDPDSVLDLESYLCSVAATTDASPDTLVALDVLGDHLADRESKLTHQLNAPFVAFLDVHSRHLQVAVNLPVYHQDMVCEYLNTLGCDARHLDNFADSDVIDVHLSSESFHSSDNADQVTCQLTPTTASDIGPQVTIQHRHYDITCSFDPVVSKFEPMHGCFAPLIRLGELLGQAAVELIRSRFGVSPAPESWGCGPCSMAAVDRLGVFPTSMTTASILASDTVDEGNSPTPTCGRTVDSPSTVIKPRVFQWQDRGEDEENDPVPFVDSEMEPVAHLSLEDQLRDPELRFVIEILNGERHASRRSQRRLIDNYELKPDALYHRVVKDGEPGLALVVPAFARASILSRYHFSLCDGVGHSGENALYQQVQRDYYWNGMKEECAAFVNACEHCGSTRSQPTIGVSAGVPPVPQRPFQVIHVDHKTMSMCNGYTSVLAVVCALTSFTIYIPVKSTTAEETLHVLIDSVFSVFGCPLVIISDNGTSFANKLMSASANLFGFRWIFVMPHTPRSNGLAEAAVKKLKLILDRHTNEHQNWVPKVKLAQMMVNQRYINGAEGEQPFTAVFGFSPPTLAALENPELLPHSTTEEASVRNTAITLAALQHRLQEERQVLKQATAALDKHSVPKRRVVEGDKVWLTYSDSERARYLRKHGHGRAWRHPFVVTAVKPHAVRLHVPKDGSVPDVLPWQSLRKCAFAAPHFHDPAMPVPDVNERGLPMIPESDESIELRSSAPASEMVDDGWSTEREYAIERIVSATKVGRGWALQVKWEGYPDTTSEPLWKILKQTNHPDILADIDRCKADYYLQNPSSRQSDLLDFGSLSLVDVYSLPVNVLSLSTSTALVKRVRNFLEIDTCVDL